MSPIRPNNNSYGDDNFNLMDSPHHINIMKKISELQLTVDSLRKEQKTKDDRKNEEGLSKSIAYNPENNEVNSSFHFFFLINIFECKIVF